MRILQRHEFCPGFQKAPPCATPRVSPQHNLIRNSTLCQALALDRAGGRSTIAVSPDLHRILVRHVANHSVRSPNSAWSLPSAMLVSERRHFRSAKRIREDTEMENTSRSNRLQDLANLTTILVSLLLSAVLIKVFLLPQSVPGPGLAQARAGKNIKQSLPGVDWAKNKRTLVLAISTQCHFCTESAPFFQRIQKERPKDLKMVAVLPPDGGRRPEVSRGAGCAG